MTNDNRKPIKEVFIDKTAANGEKRRRIYLSKNGIGAPEAFDITGTGKRGSSCICYDARMPYDNGRSCRLKEFYPCFDEKNDRYFLHRRADNVLLPNSDMPGSACAFISARDEFAASYEQLRFALEKNTALKSFIPDFSVYLSCQSDGTIVPDGTVYIVTDNADMRTFDEYLRDVHADPEAAPEHTLFVILNAVRSLAECVSLMHGCGLLHLDIKPSNFGFGLRGGRLMTEAVCMFDVNSFILSDSKPDYVLGTPGYSAPEVTSAKSTKPCERSDVYSIGALLFEAVAASGTDNAHGFDDGDYLRINELVNESRLIKASQYNSDPILTNAVSQILSECLSEVIHKRPSASELVGMLTGAIVRLLPCEYAGNYASGQKLSFVEIEDLKNKMDKHRERDLKLVMMQHLFVHPLYEHCRRTSSDRDSLLQRMRLTVLVVGCGNFGQQFLDMAVPLSMMYNTEVTFHVVSDDLGGRSASGNIYLSNRKALA
nr:protein kinase [Clostridia bacterium]